MAKPTNKANAQERQSQARAMRDQRKAREKQRKRNQILLTTVGVILAGIAIYFIVQNQTKTLEGHTADIGPQGTLAYEPPRFSSDHVAGNVNYHLDPPVGGDHNATPQTCGYYSTSVNNENAVHSLEHGAAWVTYKRSIGQAQMDKLQALTKDQTHVLVSEYDKQPTPVVASAWGYQLKLDNADDPRLAEFVKTFANGPQTREPGASCSGMGKPG